MTEPSGGASRYFPIWGWKMALLYLAAGVLGGGGCAVYLHWQHPLPQYTLLDGAKAVGSGVLIMALSNGLVGALHWVVDLLRRRWSK